VRLRPDHQDHVWSYDEFPNEELFYSLKETQVLAERCRVYYNT
jgi:hypothetical protein